MSDVEIVRDDLALDALAAGLRPDGDDEVLGLLHALRTDLDETPAPVVVPLRPRRTRSGYLVGLSAAAGLILGGLAAGAVVSADQPGQLLYAARNAVLGDPKAYDRVDELLDDALEEYTEGDVDKARDRLDKAAEELAEVEDATERRELQGRLDRLRALVGGAPSPAPRVTPRPSASASAGDDESPEPRETESEDNSGSGSSTSGSGSSGSGSDDSDNSGKGSDSSGKGSGSDD